MDYNRFDASSLGDAYGAIYENRRAANNPESGGDKKYEKVRGEKTPMPPRGDKRREDFEKWYAKNVREELSTDEAWEVFTEEGKKDACYHKVKASAKVWPSAYASGRLVQCRKKGADSYGKGPKKEELEMVFSFLMSEGFVESEEAALAMLESMSEEWYGVITEEIYTEGMADQGVSGDEAMKRHGIKPHEGTMKVKKLKPRKARKGEGLGVGARKRQGAGRVSPANMEPKGGIINNNS